MLIRFRVDTNPNPKKEIDPDPDQRGWDRKRPSDKGFSDWENFCVLNRLSLMGGGRIAQWRLATYFATLQTKNKKECYHTL